MTNIKLHKWVVLIAFNALLGVQVAEAATVTLATSPLANSTTTVVHPNLMFVLDNSGSMAWDYLPDYVSSGSGGTGSQICWNGTSDINSLATCSGVASTGSNVAVPYATSDINYLYYNPSIRYLAPVHADGTSYPNITASAANTDGFAGTGSTNLATSYIKTATASAGSTSVTLSDTTSLAVGMVVVGTGVAPGTFLTTTTNPVTFSLPTTAALSATSLSFTSGAYNHQIFCSTTSPTTVQKYSAHYVSSATTVTGTTTNGSASVASVNTTGLFVGMAVSGTGIAAGTTIATITSSTALTLSANATASGSTSLTFTPVCAENGGPSGGTSLYPTVGGGGYTAVTTYAGAPFYYVMGTLEYCTDSYFNDCTATVDATHTIPAKFRWCASYSTSTHNYSGCQDLRDAQHKIPDYLGSVWPAVSTSVAATAGLTVNSNPLGRSITSLTVNGTNILAAAGITSINAAAGGTTGAMATTICSAIHGNTAVSGYDCTTTSGATLTIKANTAGSAPNGQQVVVNGPTATAGSKATGSITITSTSGATKVDNIAVGTTSILTGTKPVYFPDGTQTTTIASTLASLIGNGYTATVDSGNASKINITANVDGAAAGILALAASSSSGQPATGKVQYTRVDKSTSTTSIKAGSNSACTAGPAVTLMNTTQSSGSTSGSSTRIKNMANGVAGVTPPSGWGVASNNVDTVTYTAPAGTSYNGWYLCVSTSGSTITTSITNFSGASGAVSGQGHSDTGMTGGASGTGALDTNATAPSTLYMANGVDAGSAHRANVGSFTRVDIVPTVNSYPASGSKGVERTDCAASTCTYAEELQNFANWYGYYRLRMLTMKSASTLAFNALDGNYRVGFDLLSHYTSGKVDLQVAQFQDTGGEVASQRTTWWSNLTGATTSGSTPLRSEVNKVGKYFAGKLSQSSGTPAQAAVAATGSLTINYGSTSAGFCSKSQYTTQSSCTTYGGSWTAGTTTGGVSSGDTISSITVGGVEILGSTKTVSCAASACTNTEINSLAASLASMISTFTSSPDYTASAASNVITITAPASLGASVNGNVIVTTTSGTINITAFDMTGGQDAVPASTVVTYEPMQYSCQQNYLLLVTDGYWNSDSYNNLTQLDGTTLIGNQDNTLTRPQYDGAQPSTTCTDTSFSSCGTLADVAAYYANTDIRSSTLNNATGVAGQDVATNNVPVSANDNNTQQHVTFFGMALGAPGTLRYQSDYQTASSGDYFDIANGAKNWPAPMQNDPTTIDDLWHATVNGHGKFFSARDPSSVGAGLSEALTAIKLRVGSAAAAATSNLMPVPGDNFAYVASYATVDWWGDLQARNIDLSTGAVSDPANASPNECVNDTGCPWSAQKRLDAMNWTTRNIYVAPTSGATGSVLRAFTYAGLTSPTEQGYFDPSTLNQYPSVVASYPTYITGTNLVNYLRGDRSLEMDGNSAVHPQVWRKRSHVLGDIVNTQPVYVKAPVFSYTDAGYSDPTTGFTTTQASRYGAVYVSANDGMVHAIASQDIPNSTTPSILGGTELWAFIPSEVMKSMKVLADSNYNHRFFVDGPVTVGDVNFGGGSSDWHTILVSGLGGGGKEFFALDITDPQNPKYLWEITNATTGFANLGYTYGNASINKLPCTPVAPATTCSGAWAVFFTSGYNNADGHGYLYAVNPQTGALLTGYPMSTNSVTGGDGGTAASPTNLGKISAWVDALKTDNTAQYIYGGDMDGNVWRFDLAKTATAHTGVDILKLAHLQNAAGNAQPITTKPEMALVGTTRVIYVGTGSYIAEADKTDTNVQSFYAIKDTLAPTLSTWSPRSDTTFQVRTLFETMDDGSLITRTDPVSGATVDARIICSGKSVANGGTTFVNHTTKACDGQPQPTDNGQPNGNAIVDWASAGGWYVDFPDIGERMNVDINLSLGTLTFATNVPASSSCTAGGYSWLNYIDFKTGINVENTSNVVSQKLANSLIVGINVVKLPNNTLAAIVTTSDYKHATLSPSFSSEAFEGKRSLWREFELY